MGERRLACVGLAVVTIAAGLVWRLAPLGLSAFWWKYGGSVLWAVMVYWVVAVMVGVQRVGLVAGLAFGVAVAVEVFKLVPGEGLDAFRRTLAGKLLLGRIFSGWDLVAYAIGIGAMAGLEWRLCRRSDG